MFEGNVAATGDISTRTIRKVQWRLMPLLFLLYVVAFLDRVNIGFAALTMNADLAITKAQFGFLAGIFFLGYFLFEIPSNLLMHRIGARVWIARILVTWGTVAVLTSFVRSAPQLYAGRFLLGAAEAGFFPGIVLYLTYWFRQREQAQVLAMFLAAVPVSSIVGAPVSGFILDHVYWLGISSWRWLLILEGFPAMVCGSLTYFFLPNRPLDATFLSQEEKHWITAELALEDEQKIRNHRLTAFQALTHRRVWHLACISFTFQIGVYAIYFYMPQAVRSLSRFYSNTMVGVLVMLPYLAGLMGMAFVSRNSDRLLERRYHSAIPAVVSAIPLILLGSTNSPSVSITLWLFAGLGISCMVAPFWSLLNEFLTGASAAAGIALVTSVGSLGGFFGPYFIGAAANQTRGIYAGLAVAGISLFVSATLIMLLPKKQIAGAASTSCARRAKIT